MYTEIDWCGCQVLLKEAVRKLLTRWGHRVVLSNLLLNAGVVPGLELIAAEVLRLAESRTLRQI